MANITIKLIKSRIGCSKKQVLILKTLRLTKLNKVAELPDNPQIRGMVKRVSHLVEIVNERTKLD
ncbi:MAG: 50S ribosomal protein L30 [Syntrophobacter sp. DG_60]|nr:MAG: 50S ribosomal protein L30 [Syntrophobacter sp. DG_60]